MGPGPITTVIQVTNVAPVVTNEQLRSLFTNIGTIREFVVYPTNDPSQQVSRVCYVRFIDPMNVGVAQHLTNTVFIDRSILVQPVIDNKIPDEAMAMKLANEGHSQNSSNSGVVSQIETVNGVQSLTTIDPRLDALGLPQYPALSPSLDPAKIEEIRRTIVVSNFNRLTTPEQLLDFFNQFGEVKYLRMTMEESAMIEYTDQSSVANALQNTGITFNGCQLNIAHSSTSILKPVYKINVDPVKILNQLPAVAAAPVAKDVRRRSRSRSYRRSRSPSTRRKRSRTPPRRSRERRRSISGSRSPVIRRKRSRSKERIRSPYVSRRRSRDRSFSRERRSRRDRSRERDRNRRRSSRDRSLERIRTYERERERDRDRDRKRRDRSREKDYDRALRERSKERIRERKRERSRSRESDRKDKHRSTRHNNKDVLIERHVRSRSRSSEIKLKLTKSPPPQAHNNNNNSNTDNDNNNNNGKNKEKESLSDINNDSNGGDLMDMDIDGLDSNSDGSIQLKKSTMIITDVAENDASLKSDEHSSSQKSLSPAPPPPEVTITTSSSKTALIPPVESPHKSSTTSTHHRSSSSSRHKHHKHQKKIPLSRDFDSDE